MNQDTQKSREKHDALAELVAAIRISQNASDMMDEAYAALLGINRTDGRCLDIVQRLGEITAGELARLSGLTTGAVTTVIDRLEEAGYLQRVRDTSDRRKVFVKLTDLAEKLGEIVFGEMGQIGVDGMSGMSVEDMKLIARFLRTSGAMNAMMSKMLREYVNGKTVNASARLRKARDFATRIVRERDALSAEMTTVWNDPDPDTRSGKL